MDPIVTIRLFYGAYYHDAWGEAVEFGQALAKWIAIGGFPPWGDNIDEQEAFEANLQHAIYMAQKEYDNETDYLSEMYSSH